jgi:hypothetical protein
MGLINKQLVLRNLGGLEARQGQYDAAAQHYRAAEQVLSHALARIIHIFEDNKGLLCYKHVVKTMFEQQKRPLNV